jgi:putative sugar O-methyltransferase
MWATWPDRVSETDFRREGDYLAQLAGGATEQHYRNTVEYIRETIGFDISALQEDDAFGVVRVDVDGLSVTRDLIDSVLEVNFLFENLDLLRDTSITVLDIGAGYGRFAHRFTQVFPNSFVYCTDAIEKSSRICESYLKYRGVERARVVSMDEAARISDRIDLAVNIHSWSECTLGAINAWLAILAEKRVKNLFVVPHTVHCATMERDGTSNTFLPWILQSGFNLVCSRPKYPAGVDGLYPTQYYLFEREGA